MSPEKNSFASPKPFFTMKLPLLNLLFFNGTLKAIVNLPPLASNLLKGRIPLPASVKSFRLSSPPCWY